MTWVFILMLSLSTGEKATLGYYQYPSKCEAAKAAIVAAQPILDKYSYPPAGIECLKIKLADADVD
jgi:hypothetical protein